MESVFTREKPLVIVGLGNMGGAIAQGARKAGLVAEGGFIAVDPHEGVVDGGRLVKSVGELDGVGGGLVVLAVKPQTFGEAGFSPELSRAIGACAVVSIMAGVTIERIERELGKRVVVRAMPNLAARIGQGVTAVSYGSVRDGAVEARVKALFGAIGPSVVELDERLMDAFTAVAGSGPAYVFALAEAMLAGAVKTGMSRVQAEEVVRQTVLGAAMVLSRSGESAGALGERVMSKGGTTEAALGVLGVRGFGEAVAEAIVAARDRGAELARGS